MAGVPISPSAGQIWFNSSANAFQFYNGSAVQAVGVSGSGLTYLTVLSTLTANGVAGGTLNTGGSIDLVNSGVTAGSYPMVTVNSKGLVTYGTALGELDVPVLTTAGRVSGNAITSGTIGGTTSIYSSGNITAQVITSGVSSTRQIQLFDPAPGSLHKITLSAPTLANDWSFVFPASAGVAGYALTTDGSGNLSWSNVASNTLPGLASGKIWIGNSAGVAAAVTPYGDLALSIAGSATVTQLQGVPVSASAPSSAGQVLRWSGGAWSPGFVAMSDLRSTVTGALSLTGCLASQTLVFSSVSDSLMCVNIGIANTQVAWGSTGANLVFAGPATGGLAAPAFRSLVAADLPPGVASQWTTVGSTINYSLGAVGVGTATPGAALDVYGTGAASAMLVPRDSTGARPTGVNGMIRYNTDLSKLELFGSGSWSSLTTSAAGGGSYLPLSGGVLTGVVAHPLGSAGAPSITFGDASTGLFASGSANLSVAVGGSTKLVVNSAGNLSVGTSNGPSVPWDNNGSSIFSGPIAFSDFITR